MAKPTQTIDIRSTAVRALLAKPIHPLLRWGNLVLFLFILTSSLLLFRLKIPRYQEVIGVCGGSGILASAVLPAGTALQPGDEVVLTFGAPSGSVRAKSRIVSIRSTPDRQSRQFLVLVAWPGENKAFDPAPGSRVQLRLRVGEHPFLNNIFHW